MAVYDRRVLDIRTRLIHAARLSKIGHYDYYDEVACDRGARPEDLFSQPPDEVVTCIACLAVST